MLINKEQEVKNFVNNIVLFNSQLEMKHYYGRSHSRDTIEVSGEFTQKIFDSLLPKYIRQTTDEILQKIDEINYLISQKEVLEDLP